jgi:putative holliday junction resolvase
VHASSSPPTAAAGRILAIDYGRRRMGLALSDVAWLTAQPLATLERTNRRNDLRRLRDLVRRHNVRRIVVGHPLHLDGTTGEMAVETERFAARIEKGLGVPVELVDERLSSWEAERMLPPSAAREREGAVDRLAAAVILRDYLERGQTRRRTPPNAERAHGDAQEHASRRRRKQMKV